MIGFLPGSDTTFLQRVSRHGYVNRLILADNEEK